MRDVQDCTERLATLVELLTGLANLEIRAEISPVDAKPGSDEARLRIYFTGRDTPVLTANNGRVLEAIETLAVEILGLTAAESDTVLVDAGNFLADQEKRLRKAARVAINQVRFTGAPHVFPPMSDRDRRLLQQALITSGLYFETLGNHSTRWVVLFPKELTPALQTTSTQHSAGG